MLGVIGYGYWGPNIVRNLHGHMRCAGRRWSATRALRALARECASPIRGSSGFGRQGVAALPGHRRGCGDHAGLDPLRTGEEALENGKHVFVEKPFTSNAAQAEELIELAARKNLNIMVDHTFLFTGAVRKIRELTESGALGDLYYYDSLRVNLGLFQHDVSVIWDLAPHDLSIMDHVIKGEPEAIVATGENHLNGVERRRLHDDLFPAERDRAHQCELALAGEDPHHPDWRQKKMIVWNDLVADEKIRVYDKGVQIENGKGIRDLLVSYRTGDMWAPQLEQLEALRVELDYFADCIESGKTPFNDGHAGLRVVRMLEAAENRFAKEES